MLTPSLSYDVPYITREAVEVALLAGNLDKKYKEWIEMFRIKNKTDYTEELVRRGFPSIHWMTLDEWMIKNSPGTTLENIELRCDACSEDNARFRCSNCKKARFCSKEHQLIFWDIHKVLCTKI